MCPSSRPLGRSTQRGGCSWHSQHWPSATGSGAALAGGQGLRQGPKLPAAANEAPATCSLLSITLGFLTFGVLMGLALPPSCRWLRSSSCKLTLNFLHVSLLIEKTHLTPTPPPPPPARPLRCLTGRCWWVPGYRHDPDEAHGRTPGSPLAQSLRLRKASCSGSEGPAGAPFFPVAAKL